MPMAAWTAMNPELTRHSLFSLTASRAAYAGRSFGKDPARAPPPLHGAEMWRASLTAFRPKGSSGGRAQLRCSLRSRAVRVSLSKDTHLHHAQNVRHSMSASLSSAVSALSYAIHEWHTRVNSWHAQAVAIGGACAQSALGDPIFGNQWNKFDEGSMSLGGPTRRQRGEAMPPAHRPSAALFRSSADGRGDC